MFNLKRAGGKKESSYSSKSQCPQSTRQTDYISLHPHDKTLRLLGNNCRPLIKECSWLCLESRLIVICMPAPSF